MSSFNCLSTSSSSSPSSVSTSTPSSGSLHLHNPHPYLEPSQFDHIQTWTLSLPSRLPPNSTPYIHPSRCESSSHSFPPDCHAPVNLVTIPPISSAEHPSPHYQIDTQASNQRCADPNVVREYLAMKLAIMKRNPTQ